MRTFEEMKAANVANRSDLVEEYKAFVISRFDGFGEWVGDDVENISPDVADELRKFAGVYTEQHGCDDVDYHKRNYNNFYFTRYGMSYMYMYSLIYDIIFKTTNKSLDVLSLGCGGFVDKVGLDYAHIPFKKRKGYVKYTGVDMKRWEVRCYSDAQIEDDDTFSFFQCDIAGYISALPERKLNHNVLMFPLIINELDENARTRFLGALENLELTKNEYYICVSHAKNQTVSGTEFVDDMVSVFENKGCTAQSDIYELMEAPKDEYFKNDWARGNDRITSITPRTEDGKTVFEEGDRNGCNLYAYKSAYTPDSRELDSLFLPGNGERTFKNKDFKLENLEDAKEYMKKLGDELGGHLQLSNRVSQMFFQVIRLTRNA